MRLRIEAAPGELEAKGDLLVRAVAQLAGTDLDKGLRQDLHEQPRALDVLALRQNADRALAHVEQIRKAMLAKLHAVLDEVGPGAPSDARAA